MLRRYRRLLLLVLLPLTLFVLVAELTDDLFLKHIINMVRIAASAGICAAYTPGAAEFLLSEDPIEPGDWLGYGIVLTWLATFMITMFQIVWIAHGQPISWVNTDLTNFMYFVSTSGGVCHLFAPQALKQEIPKKRWVQLGVTVTVAVLIAFVAAYAADFPLTWTGILSEEHGLPFPHGE